MTVYLTIKPQVRNVPTIDRIPFSIDASIETSSELLAYIIRRSYGNKTADSASILSYLTDDSAETGKKSDTAEAIGKSLQLYEDGVIKLTIDGESIEIDKNIHLYEDHEIIFDCASTKVFA